MPNPYHDDNGQFSDAGGGVAVGKSFSPAAEKPKLPSLSFPVAPLGQCYDGSAKVGQSLAAAGKKVKYAYDPKADGGQGHMWVLVQDPKGEGWQAVDSYYGPVNDAQFYKPKYAFDDYEKIQELMPSYKEVFEIDPKTHKPTGRKVIENKMNNSSALADAITVRVCNSLLKQFNFNENHDELGRFAEGSGGKGGNRAKVEFDKSLPDMEKVATAAADHLGTRNAELGQDMTLKFETLMHEGHYSGNNNQVSINEFHGYGKSATEGLSPILADAKAGEFDLAGKIALDKNNGSTVADDKSVQNYVNAIIDHEVGHGVLTIYTNNFEPIEEKYFAYKGPESWQKTIEGKDLLGNLASMDSAEAFAESYSAYKNGYGDKLPEDVLTYVKTAEKAVSNLGKSQNSSGDNMPIQECQSGGKDGFSYGPEGMCYVHDGSDEGKKAARAKAEKQGQAIEISKHMDAALNEELNYHVARVQTYKESKTRNPVEKGVWAVFTVNYEGQLKLTSYEFDPSVFSEEQAKAWLDEHHVELSFYDPSSKGFETASERLAALKAANASGEPTHEYLKKVWDLLKSHPGIWSQIKDEIHLQARGSAGGQLRGRGGMMAEGEFVKSENAAFIDGDYIETDEYIDAPTVFAKEGVFIGSNGRPTKKVYETLKANVARFLGASATPQHISTDTLRPSDRWLGHAVSVQARDDKRDIFGYTRYYKKHLNADELQKIRNKQYPDGSIGYFTEIKDESGEFDGKPYEAVEVGNLIITEYATMFDGTKGACTREQGCGPFQNSAVVEESDDVLRLINGKVKKCPRKLMNQSESGDIDTMDESELKKILNETVKTAVKAAVKEGLGDLPDRVAALEKQKNEASVIKLAEVPEFKELQESIKQVNAALPDIKSFKAEQEAAKLATQKAAFAKHLNAAHQPTGKADDEFEKAWNAASADPLGRDVWLANHPEVKVAIVEKRDFTGKILNSGASDIIATAQANANKPLMEKR